MNSGIIPCLRGRLCRIFSSAVKEPRIPKNLDQDRRVVAACLVILTAIALGAAMYWLRPVLVPFVLAVFLTYCLIPVIDFQRHYLKFPKWLACTGTAVLGVLFLVFLAMVVSESVGQISANAGRYRNQILKLLEDALVGLRLEKLGLPLEDSKRYLSQVAGKGLENVVSGFVGSLVSILSNGILVLIFMIFLIAGQTTGMPIHAGFRGEIESRIKRYILTKLFLSIITGILVGSILTILHIELAFVFGFFAFFLNFIPSIGSVVATLLPIPIVIVNPELSPTVKILAFLLPGTIQFLIGNILEPKIMGESMGLHPVTILAALILFGMMWGVVGMVLATPIAAIIRILCEGLDLTRPIAAVMAGRLDSLSAASGD